MGGPYVIALSGNLGLIDRVLYSGASRQKSEPQAKRGNKRSTRDFYSATLLATPQPLTTASQSSTMSPPEKWEIDSMDTEKAVEFANKILSAWNTQDVESVISCYTEDCIYQDPNTRGPIKGHDAFRRYLRRLFQEWKMHWSLREFFLFSDGDGGAFLWHARLTPASGGKTFEIDGMDLVIISGARLSRNEVYFDRMSLFAKKQ